MSGQAAKASTAAMTKGKMQDSDKSFPAPLTGPVEHWCRHPGCKKWGGWGYDRGAGRIDWWCYEHKPGGKETPSGL